MKSMRWYIQTFVFSFMSQHWTFYHISNCIDTKIIKFNYNYILLCIALEYMIEKEQVILGPDLGGEKFRYVHCQNGTSLI